jgi:hypothetical protein
MMSNPNTRSIASPTLAANRTWTFPDADDTVVIYSANQTLTNKTIESLLNTITGLASANITGLAYSKLISVPPTIVKTDKSNTYSTGVDQTFRQNSFQDKR